ncbi:hypothetical protein FRB96_000987 [Tulasnella sp. 330]|nr:hypothetical protein FRB96_000987 [Tulasnella sp. 330]KAG8872704.1 hypothetical protein FRB97_007419 [Tulasnella sp. 331]
MSFAALHTSTRRSAISEFKMPAMSPTMTEGGIASWKKKEGEAFETGDILLEIETDKATMDVEAQDDGIMGKILSVDGTKGVPVGTTIALLAEEGDDISDLKAPAQGGSSSKSAAPQPPSSTPAESPRGAYSQPQSGTQTSTSGGPPPQAPLPEKSEGHAHPHSSRPLFPSVMRLLQDHNLSADVDSLGIKGTGVRGMITKGDILAHLGLAQGPNGTLKDTPRSVQPSHGKPVEDKGIGKREAPTKKEFTGDEARKAFLAGLQKRAAPVAAPGASASFDSIIADYIPKTPTSQVVDMPLIPMPPPLPTKVPPKDYFEGLI